jgi:ABC-type nitrate/sulfonate/bicarbonate transport system ATPase subunit
VREIATLVSTHSIITVLVTHNLSDVVRLGDHLFFLSPRPARIVAELSVRTLRSARGEAEIAEIKAEIVRRTNGDRS